METKKNVLLICTDHFPGSFINSGSRGPHTPVLDTLASDGIRFTNFYSECPVCIPARRCLMTGLSPRTHGDRVYSTTMRMPDVPTLAETFHNAGYQTFAVGKLHVYPQRNRIGFDDVLLQEEGRYEFGMVDDYQIWLGEQGYAGQEFMHAVGNNTYYTRPWHLPEYTHPTNWATKEMIKQFSRKDPDRPVFYYLSYSFPHPPLVPLQTYYDMYDDSEIDEPVCGDWVDDSYIMRAMTEASKSYSRKEIIRAKRAFYAQCTHIDSEIRLLIGTLREFSLLDDTVIVFTSDHGDMLFDHHMVAKRCFYERAANIPLILTGKPLEGFHGKIDDRPGTLADLMPTLLDICGISIPESVEGISLMADTRHEMIYGECGEGNKATRMVHDGRFKLIYYPAGNVLQLFDLDSDPEEMHNVVSLVAYAPEKEKLTRFMLSKLYGDDLKWISNGKLTGFRAPAYIPKTDYGLYNQRGYHWPAPVSYANMGKNL
jgi:arylsulfatase